MRSDPVTGRSSRVADDHVLPGRGGDLQQHAFRIARLPPRVMCPEGIQRAAMYTLPEGAGAGEAAMRCEERPGNRAGHAAGPCGGHAHGEDI